MTAADSRAVDSVTPEQSVSRAVRLVRVAVLLASGMAIAFSATMHENVGFDLGLFSIALGGIGIAHLIHAYVGRGRVGASVALMLGIVAVAGAIAVPLVGISAAGTSAALAVVIAAWALVSGLLEFIAAFTQQGTRQDAILLGALGILLAMLVLVFREDLVAVIGFFGAYAVIAGVFLGISAFDSRRAEHPEPTEPLL